MKFYLKDFVSSIYNPQFYKDIPNKSLKDIFKYMLNISLFFSILFTIYTIIYLLINLKVYNVAVAISSFFACFSAFINYFLIIFITWIITGWIYAILLLMGSYIFRKRISYANSVKLSMYAVSSIGIIDVIIYRLPFSSILLNILSMIAPFLILFINLRKKS